MYSMILYIFSVIIRTIDSSLISKINAYLLPSYIIIIIHRYIAICTDNGSSSTDPCSHPP